ncbi:uncharacterized protein LOC131226723 isoform X2 [Magnolia sinica]|uniref:uncharacterized protein LOC131226723 isoform X2 n=1 Tax=Magnolia sinica TaxID=86752 RepID=UPI00265894D7|nr:uncharacterized protein LOC131226723 isoform X2 [Magnolia sinica]
MAVSAFRSTSKRGNVGTSSNTISSAKENNTEDLGKRISHRRSRSVSAVSRSYLGKSPSSNVIDFSKRDNPLFCNSSPSPPDELESESVIGISKFSEKSVKSGETATKSVGSGVSDGRRGRSVSRSSDAKNQFLGPRKEYGRSLSRIDTGRQRRSVSRGHCGNSENEMENDYGLRNKNIGNFTANERKNHNVTTNASDLANQTRSSQTWSSRHPLSSDGSSSCMQALNWEDGISTSSYSETEEKTAVFEQMKSDLPAGDAATGGIYETVRSEVRRAVSEIRNDLETAVRRKNPAIITTTNIADIPPELVNPDAIELVSDIRREYATKLEESQERARKLRADLATEEQRGQELSRILKEILPDPKTSETQKSRPRRKTSIERRKMSNRLTEEAMTYFDECVSISTFDSSDFSAPEDPPFGSVAATPMAGNRIFPCRSSSASATQEFDNQSQCSHGYGGFDPTASSSSNDSIKPIHANANLANPAGSNAGFGGNLQFPFLSTETEGIHDIQNYIKKFEKDFQKEGREHRSARSSYNADDYDSSQSTEKLLFDQVIFRNRIRYGGLLLCDVRIC